MAEKKKVWRDRSVYARWLARGDQEGWSLTQLARRSRIPVSALQRWRRRLRDSESRDPSFLEVVPIGSPAVEVEILLSSGRRLRLSCGATPVSLAELVALLESC